uniref:BHLH domain-containing protein n=1 Tax=Rhabditophanes sp. KR3021 TaxID=114890 RepID=A0AC35TM45_9BILA
MQVLSVQEVSLPSNDQNQLYSEEKVPSKLAESLSQLNDFEDEDNSSFGNSRSHSVRSGSGGNGSSSPNTPPGNCGNKIGEIGTVNDRRIRREVANSNERRRMQSINEGFQSLRALLPRKYGEKMSKASILQQTAEMIHSIQADKDRLAQENESLIQTNVMSAKKRKFEESQQDTLLIREVETLKQTHKQQTLDYEQRLQDIFTMYRDEAQKRQFFEQEYISNRKMQDNQFANVQLLASKIPGLLDNSFLQQQITTSNNSGSSTPMDISTPTHSANLLAYNNNQQQNNYGNMFNNMEINQINQLNLQTNVQGVPSNNITHPNLKLNVPNVNYLPQLQNNPPNTQQLSLPNGGSASTTPLAEQSVSHQNLCAIFEAIRQIEGSNVCSTSPTTPTSDVLVR